MLVPLTPAALRVVDACRAAGFRPFIVGGAVRDAMLGRVANDLDIEVHGAPSLAALAAELGQLAPFTEQGASFGILSARIDDESFELSVAPSSSLEDSFARRDFTVNAIGWDPATQEIIDPFGGQRDLAKGLLRHTSSHFSRDPLRVLRGVRLAGQLGFAFAAETTGLCRELSDRFGEIATERVWAEWRRLARTAVHWPEALAALLACGWAPHFPELAATRGVRQDPAWHAEGDLWTHLGLAARAAALAAESDGLAGSDREVVVFATLLHDLGKATHTVVTQAKITSAGHAEAGVEPAKAFLAGIGAPAAVSTRVLPLIREHMTHVSTQGAPSRPAVRRLMRRLSMGGATIVDWARVVDADCAGRVPAKRSPSAQWLSIAESLGGAPARRILRGGHLLARGYLPGPKFSLILMAAADAQDREVFDDEAGALAWLETVQTSENPRPVTVHPQLPPRLKSQLDAVEPSHHGSVAYAPCRVTLRSGEVLDRVILAESTSAQALWGADPAEGAPSVTEIAAIESSPSRLPARFANGLYEAGESGMGYAIFTVVMRDGTRLPFLTGSMVDFPNWPEGVHPLDVIDVLPHEGREQLVEHQESAPVVWMLYSE
jgi:tRNA nucleotidyltransferase (CCA-adding enzyme)